MQNIGGVYVWGDPAVWEDHGAIHTEYHGDDE